MSGIESWSTTPANNNQAPPFGWPAGILPSQVEPIGRQMMTSLAAWYQAAEWINYNFTPTYIGATQFSLPGNATATYHVGRRVQATDGATSVYGAITVSVFTSLTTVTVVWDSGVLQSGVTIVYVGITSKVNTSAPAPVLTFANPSANVGLTAVNGSAATPMRSDASPPLDQTISPSWTGLHNFGSQAAAGWYSGSGAIQIQHSGIWAFDNGSGNIQTEILTNAYQSALGTYKYAATAAAMRLATTVGVGFQFQYAASGSAGAAVTFSTALTVNQVGAVSISAPGSGPGLTSSGPSNNTAIRAQGSATTGQSYGIDIVAGTNSSDAALRVLNQAGTVSFLTVRGDGVVFGNDGTNAFELGYKDIPQNLQTANYAPALSDRGKGVDFNGTSLTCTIPANASIAFPIGTTILITNLNATSLSIAITTDTLTLAGTTTTGTRTLGQNGEATIRKVTSTSWLISGSGLS